MNSIRSIEADITNRFSADVMPIVDIHLNWSLISETHHIFAWNFTIAVEYQLAVFVVGFNLSQKVSIAAIVPAGHHFHKIDINHTVIIKK